MSYQQQPAPWGYGYPPPRKKMPQWKQLGLGLALITGILTTLLLLSLLPKKPDLEKAAKAEERDRRRAAISAWTMAQTLVKRRLKAPSTASFGSVLDGDYQQAEDVCMRTNVDAGTVTWLCRGWVDAQNSFGAQIRQRFTISMKSTDGHWEVISGPTFDE